MVNRFNQNQYEEYPTPRFVVTRRRRDYSELIGSYVNVTNVLHDSDSESFFDEEVEDSSGGSKYKIF